MEKRSKKLMYVSGPPCAGKSTVSKAIIQQSTSTHYIPGDEFWIQHEECDLKERIEKTNQDILQAVVNSSSDMILLEWVPGSGSFVDQVKRFTSRNHIDFVHVVITAPKTVLKQRKQSRDGNEDLGPVNVDNYTSLSNVYMFDSSHTAVDEIASSCIRLIDKL